MNRCSMTGRPMDGPSDGIYDDGEWISWEWINGQIYEQGLREEYPLVSPELAELFESLVQNASDYHATTGRYLQIWGELGELYAEIEYGIDRHKPTTPGSDGRLGNDFVEIKTISPEKKSDVVYVKRAGNFNKLLVVKIDAEFQFESRMLDRKNIPKGDGKCARVRWSCIPDEHQTKSKPVAETANHKTTAKASNGKPLPERVRAIINRLQKPKVSKPAKVKKLKNMIASVFQKSLSEKEVESLVQSLISRGYVKITGTKVSYALPGDA